MKVYGSYSTYSFLWNNSFPSHWDVLPMYALAKEKVICNCIDLPLLSVYLDVGVIPFSAKAEKRTNVTSKDLSKYQRVDSGDFVLNNQQAWRGSVGISFHTGIVSPAYIVLSMNKLLNSRYANYLLRSQIMVDQYLINSKSVGSIQRNIYWPSLKRTNVPIPPREEQTQIVRFLDWKVSEINKLISIRKRQITEFEKLEKAVINRVVTKGLQPNVELKVSDEKWIGEVPRHWEIAKLKRVTTIRNEKAVYNPDTDDNYIGLENIKSNSNELILTASEYDTSIQSICYEGDLMFSKLRPYLAKVIIAPYDSFCTSELLIFSSFDGEIRFLRYVLLHERFIEAVDSSTYGAKMPRANTNYILNLAIPLPPLNEQREIADYIDKKLSSIDKETEILRKQVDELQELKTRLISDVVTGKIDVRNVEIPEYEFVEDDIDIEEEIAGQEY